MKGKFIVLEGVDGVGKSTQAKLLQEWFQFCDYPVYLRQEPLALYRNYIAKATSKIDQLELFNQSRQENLEVIKWYLVREKANVICDRYALSSFVYQCINFSPSPTPENTVNQEMFKILTEIPLLKPDITIILDCPIEERKRRAKNAEIVRVDHNVIAKCYRQIKIHEELITPFTGIIRFVSTNQNAYDVNTQIVNYIKEIG